MKLKISFKEPRRGIYTMYVSPNEIVQFSRGRAKRIPVDKTAIVNTIPIKYITSIKFIDKPSQRCTHCGKEKSKLLCAECILSIWKSPKNTSNFNELKEKVY